MKAVEETLKVGDRMRFSTELLHQINDDGGTTVIVEVLKIAELEDGTKIVYLGTMRG